MLKQSFSNPRMTLHRMLLILSSSFPSFGVGEIQSSSLAIKEIRYTVYHIGVSLLAHYVGSYVRLEILHPVLTSQHCCSSSHQVKPSHCRITPSKPMNLLRMYPYAEFLLL